jgi:hypothetical protein
MPSALEQFNVSAVDATLDGHLASEADTTACPSSPLRMPENSVPLSFGIGTFKSESPLQRRCRLQDKKKTERQKDD